MNFTTLALGGEIKVPSVDGEPETLKIPEGTATGSVFRLRGKGHARRGRAAAAAICSSPCRRSRRAS